MTKQNWKEQNRQERIKLNTFNNPAWSVELVRAERAQAEERGRLTNMESWRILDSIHADPIYIAGVSRIRQASEIMGNIEKEFDAKERANNLMPELEAATV